MPEILIHNKTKTVFRLAAKNKTKYRTDSGAIFPIHECKEWKENFPMIAVAMPPEVGQVVAHGEHIFTVLNRSRDKETQKAKLWHEWNADTRIGQWYWMDDCAILTDDMINKWVELIAYTRHNYKEDTPEYRRFIQVVPEPIRELCIVRSFNKILEKMPIGKEGEFF